MEPRINNRIEFLRRYWNYYILLEDDFLKTERYIAIDKLNFNAFSNEYIKQYQTICSEIDVIAKSYCKEMDNSFSGSTINYYCKCITDNVPDFSQRKVRLINCDIEIFPWKDWNYTLQTQPSGRQNTVVTNPDWWTKYNKLKHNRTTINNETHLPYYKLANQINVLNSLAALFQLEMYYFRTLHQKFFPHEPDVIDYESNLFRIEGWNYKWRMIGKDFAIQNIDEVENAFNDFTD